MKTWQKKLGICTLFLLLVMSIFLVLECYRKLSNTLQNNGNWIVSKTLLKMAVMGSANYNSGTQALHGEKVNLGAWHGFQEIIYSQQLHPQKVEFDFFLSDNSYFYFIFNKQKDNFSAIRLSANPNFNNVYVTALGTGEFTSQQEIKGVTLSTNTWHHFILDFSQPTSSTLTVNGQAIPLSASITPNTYLGFRGSLNPVFIDNVLIRLSNGDVIQDDFRNSYSQDVFLITMGVFLSLLYIVHRVIPNILGVTVAKRFITSLVFFFNLFIAILFVYIFITYFYVGQYPNSDSLFSKLKAGEREYTLTEADKVNKTVMTQYGKKEKDVIRILVLGTSQTWGAGADTEQSTFVALAENQLNQNSLPKYQFINTGISGVSSTMLTKLYEENWIHLEPDLVIINLATNDSGDEEAFKSNLQKVISRNKQMNINTVFFLEPNANEDFREPNKLYSTMIQIAEENGVRYFDLNQYMIERNLSGIVWWDFVHPTSYGHKLISEAVVKLVTEVTQEYDVSQRE